LIFTQLHKKNKENNNHDVSVCLSSLNLAQQNWPVRGKLFRVPPKEWTQTASFLADDASAQILRPESWAFCERKSHIRVGPLMVFPGWIPDPTFVSWLF
jgi:hypothetical protein